VNWHPFCWKVIGVTPGDLGARTDFSSVEVLALPEHGGGMKTVTNDNGIEVFSTCPLSTDRDSDTYLQKVVNVARWSEEAGCRGILIYADNSLVDPWMVSQIILENTDALCPLPAVQPVYMHPYTVAKAVSTLAYLYGRRIYLNMIAGGFANDLRAFNDSTPHDKRYARLAEYTAIIKELLSGESPVTFNGEFYAVDKLRLTPPLPRRLFPGIFISGSSEAGLAAAKALGATAVKYPKPRGEEASVSEDCIDYGIRVGIISRESEEEAWAVAHARFPEDHKGQLMHALAVKTSDSVWHKQLASLEEEKGRPYWLVPFHNYKTFCPYLVGSYERIADEIAGYIAAGYKTFLLDIPPSQEELFHISRVFRQAFRAAIP
jgi:alkanesulfonate monooxygenase